MDERQIIGHIHALVDEERGIEGTDLGGRGHDAQRRLREIEVALDQCWDLLRQRRARRLAGQEPDDAIVRPPIVVETYDQ
ncbi:MAG: DUF2630 family protein [Ilumatobacteraceae bacterium]